MTNILAVTSKLGWGTINTKTGEYVSCELGKSQTSRAKDFFGLTWDNRYIYTLGREADSIKMYDKKLHYIGNVQIPIKLFDGHQILWIEKYNELVLTDAKRDMVVILNLQTGKADSFLIKSDDIAESHVNALYFDEVQDRLYVNCHNKGASCVKVYDYPDLTEPVDEKWIGVKAHNIWFEDDMLTICSSGKKQIIDETGRVKYNCQGFVRGVAITDDRIYAGQSGWRQLSGKYEFHGTDKQRCASILVLDNNYICKNELFLPLRIKEIFDIRILNRFDYSHNKKGFWQSNALE